MITRENFAAEMHAVLHVLENLKSGKLANAGAREDAAAPAEAIVRAHLAEAGFSVTPDGSLVDDKPPAAEPQHASFTAKPEDN